MGAGISGVEKPSWGGRGVERGAHTSLSGSVLWVLLGCTCFPRWSSPSLWHFPDSQAVFFPLCFFARHSRTRHQFYLQLRKDVLEERLYCNDETLLQLGVLALQAEFGSYPKEVGVISGVTGKRTVGRGGH